MEEIRQMSTKGTESRTERRVENFEPFSKQIDIPTVSTLGFLKIGHCVPCPNR